MGELVLPPICVGLGGFGRDRESKLAVANAFNADRLLQLDSSYVEPPREAVSTLRRNDQVSELTRILDGQAGGLRVRPRLGPGVGEGLVVASVVVLERDRI